MFHYIEHTFIQTFAKELTIVIILPLLIVSLLIVAKQNIMIIWTIHKGRVGHNDIYLTYNVAYEWWYKSWLIWHHAYSRTCHQSSLY